jgi:RHS repeat-associated protein
VGLGTQLADVTGFDPGGWSWANQRTDTGQPATLAITTSGVFTVTVWMREDGLRLDRLLLTTNPSFTPTSFGPAESSQYSPGTAAPTLLLTRTIVYTYDNLYRLTNAGYTTGESYAYEYDPVGNRLKQIINGNTTTYLYDAANRLSQVNGQSYTFDNNGNLLTTGAMTNTFDAANRLTASTRDSITVQPVYNGVGDRVGQTVGTTTTHFALDVLGLPEVIYTSEGNAYLHLPGVIVAKNNTGETRYLLSDGLGSIRQAVDDNGTVVTYNEFDPYGNPIQNGSEPYGFTGEWWQEVGLLYLRARYYNPETGSFLSKDPVESEPPYTYVRGNVVNRIDPSGMQGGPLDPNSPLCYQPNAPNDIPLPGCTLPPKCYEPIPSNDIYDPISCIPPPAGPLYPPPGSPLTRGELIPSTISAGGRPFTDPKELFAYTNWFYSKNNPYWNCYDSFGPIDIDISSSDNWYDVVRDFVCEYGPNPRTFTDNDFITKSLRKTSFIGDARLRYYLFGQTEGNRSFNPLNWINPLKNGRFIIEPLEAEKELAMGPDTAGTGRILGGFSYEISQEGPYLRWTINNLMSRESGSRFPLGYIGTSSLENELGTANSLSDLFSFRSVLQSKTRDKTVDPEGGGDLYMTITWKELDFSCYSNFLQWLQ